MIFNYFGPADLVIIWRKCCLGSSYSYVRKKDITYIPVSLDESSSKIFVEYLPVIWQKYSEQLFAKARRGPKKMLILFYLFQEYFTDAQFEVFVKRIKNYDDVFLHNYVIKCSRNLPKKYLNQLESSFLLKDLKE